ncbi:MAG: CDP-2,3-bis-(O-geranylgeranyl)-sn-glycerol synthase [Euryarchaeota archaeon]|nr:CDP-2,3-bis-(O-geranylgeranyl)-sn-glycerol synthase [Euryarchaeota archaeon]
MGIIEGIISTLWLMIPIYLPNPGAVLFGGGTPMDFGKKFWDGRRVLGKGKTWRGFIGGGFLGFAFGIFQNFIARYLPQAWFPVFAWDWRVAVPLILLMAYSSIFGDSVGSFTKRRLGIQSGGRAFLIDQLMFVVISWLFLYLLFPAWFLAHFWNVVSVATVFILTPFIHRGVNILAYKLGYKDVPW